MAGQGWAGVNGGFGSIGGETVYALMRVNRDGSVSASGCVQATLFGGGASANIQLDLYKDGVFVYTTNVDVPSNPAATVFNVPPGTMPLSPGRVDMVMTGTACSSFGCQSMAVDTRIPSPSSQDYCFYNQQLTAHVPDMSGISTPCGPPGTCSPLPPDTTPPCPTISSFTASPSSVPLGQSTTLSWNTPNATSVTISGVGTFSGSSGSVVVTPPGDTTYTLTANGGGACTAPTAQVTVTTCQSISSYTASATTINQGDSVTLTTSTPGASSATITDLLTGQVFSVAVPSGSLVVTPASTRTYRLTANGNCAAVTQDITINVVPPPSILSFSSNVGSVCPGGQATLSYNTSNATSADINGTPVGLPSGSLVVTPSAPSTTYTLTLHGGVGGGVVATQQLTVTVTPAPSIGSYTASASTVNVGQSTTLSYTTSGGTSATITDLTSGAVTAVAVPNGSLAVTPPSSRTYRLTLSGTCGTVTQDVAITVNQPPTISSLTASPTSVCAGQSSTLSWSSSGGASASITDLTSGAVTAVPVNGSLAVTPPSTRTYRLTVTNGAGSVTSDVGVSVSPLAVINGFSASATTVNAGQSTTLSFNVSNTSSRSITDLTSGVVTNLGAESGTLVVTPATTRTYRLTASNGCNTVTQDLTITVIQPPTISAFTASASPVCSGAASTLSWTASGGTSATISAAGLPGSPVSVNPNSGSLTVNPTSSTTYTLTVTNSAGSVTRTVTVNVTPAPSISSYGASATTVNAGQSTTLSYSTANTTSATITDLTSGAVTAVAVPNGSLAVTPPTTRTYRLTANGTCGTVTQDITITVTQSPAVSSFTASASPICSGASSTLSWSASGGTSATISAPGLPGSPVSVNPNSGTLVVSPTTTTTYTLTETNASGSTTATVTVTITPAPTISSFTASPSTVTQGQTSTLAWATATGTSATITDLSTGTVTSVGVNSSLAVTPATTRTYRLTLTGSCGSVTRDVTVTVTPCQTISSFTASATTIAQGSSTTLSYTLTGATTATITDLSTGVVTNVPVQSGSLVVSPSSTRTYRLTATGACAAVTQDLTITVTTPNYAGWLDGADCTHIFGWGWDANQPNTPIFVNLYIDGVFNQRVLANVFRADLPPAGIGDGRHGYDIPTPAAALDGGSHTVSLAFDDGVTWVRNGTSPFGFTNVQPKVISGCAVGNVLLGTNVANGTGAVGPTSNNDDYTNMTLTAGVSGPAGTLTTAGGTIVFSNKIKNLSAANDTVTITARLIPAGFTVAASVDGGATYVPLNSGGSVSINLTAGVNASIILVRVTAPASLPVLTGFSTVLRATSGLTPTNFNETIDRLWTGFVRADKSQSVTNSTGVGAATDPVSGAVIQYTVNYSNVTTAAGTLNVDLNAASIVLTEDGNAVPNNWATTTNHVAGSATDSRGGSITGDTAGSSLLTDTIASLGPGQSGVFIFKRLIR